MATRALECCSCQRSRDARDAASGSLLCQLPPRLALNAGAGADAPATVFIPCCLGVRSQYRCCQDALQLPPPPDLLQTVFVNRIKMPSSFLQKNSSRRKPVCSAAFTSQPHSRCKSRRRLLARNSPRARTWLSQSRSRRWTRRGLAGGNADSS